MISNEERREVAQKLRDAATECYNYGVLESDVLNILGVYATDSACLVSSDSVMDVADLIDRPTCKTIEHEGTDEFHVCKSCSRCSYGWFEDIYDKPYSYCPNCGAEVMDDGD